MKTSRLFVCTGSSGFFYDTSWCQRRLNNKTRQTKECGRGAYVSTPHMQDFKHFLLFKTRFVDWSFHPYLVPNKITHVIRGKGIKKLKKKIITSVVCNDQFNNKLTHCAQCKCCWGDKTGYCNYTLVYVQMYANFMSSRWLDNNRAHNHLTRV